MRCSSVLRKSLMLLFFIILALNACNSQPKNLKPKYPVPLNVTLEDKTIAAFKNYGDIHLAISRTGEYAFYCSKYDSAIVILLDSAYKEKRRIKTNIGHLIHFDYSDKNELIFVQWSANYVYRLSLDKSGKLDSIPNETPLTRYQVLNGAYAFMENFLYKPSAVYTGDSPVAKDAHGQKFDYNYNFYIDSDTTLFEVIDNAVMAYHKKWLDRDAKKSWLDDEVDFIFGRILFVDPKTGLIIYGHNHWGLVKYYSYKTKEFGTLSDPDGFWVHFKTFAYNPVNASVYTLVFDRRNSKYVFSHVNVPRH